MLQIIHFEVSLSLASTLGIAIISGTVVGVAVHAFALYDLYTAESAKCRTCGGFSPSLELIIGRIVCLGNYFVFAFDIGRLDLQLEPKSEKEAE